MKLGLLADIHEDVERLRLAIDRLRALGVDQFVMLGDVFDHGDRPRLDAVMALLDEVGAVGVWGNHDFGLCVDPDEHVRTTYSARTLASFARLRGRLEIDGCLFTHIEPWLDPTQLEDLWQCGPHPDRPEQAALSFAAAPQRLMFMGHNHRWIIARPGEFFPWKGETPFTFDPAERYLIVVHAVCDGWCAHLDTAANVLTPVALDGPGKSQE
jgi:Calcineurin-like phosphoesterase superfamily domain